MAADGLERNGLGVLADQCQDHAATLELLDRVLKVYERFAHAVVSAQSQPFEADVADDPAPQRVIEIQNEELASAAGQTGERGPYVLFSLGEDIDAERDLAEVPAL